MGEQWKGDQRSQHQPPPALQFSHANSSADMWEGSLPPPPLIMDSHQPNHPNQQLHFPHQDFTSIPPAPLGAPQQPAYIPMYNGPQPQYQGHPQQPYPDYASSPPSSSSPLTLEENELKRLRNTAASARFRAKKKQREASLENSAREKKERLEALEKRIKDLEEENRWLKELIVEKKNVADDVKKLRDRYGAVAEEMKEFEHKDDDASS